MLFSFSRFSFNHIIIHKKKFVWFRFSSSPLPSPYTVFSISIWNILPACYNLIIIIIILLLSLCFSGTVLDFRKKEEEEEKKTVTQDINTFSFRANYFSKKWNKTQKWCKRKPLLHERCTYNLQNPSVSESRTIFP